MRCRGIVTCRSGSWSSTEQRSSRMIKEAYKRLGNGRRGRGRNRRGLVATRRGRLGAGENPALPKDIQRPTLSLSIDGRNRKYRWSFVARTISQRRSDEFDVGVRGPWDHQTIPMRPDLEKCTDLRYRNVIAGQDRHVRSRRGTDLIH